jgi:tetratricopeptide (TPR) repeat protein
VGRRAELSVFREALREAISGKGGVVTLVGDPGLGKTRLVHECRKLFLAWAGAASGRLPLWLEGRAASYASSTPYGLYQQLLARWVGVTSEEGEKLARPALEMAMKAVFGAEASEEQVGLLAQMMGLGPGKAGPGPAQLSPEQLQRATFEALKALVSKLVTHGPTVLVLEDLHWADPTSLHLTEELSSLAKDGPLLLVLTRRPEPDPGVSALEGGLERDSGLKLCRLELSPLPQDAERDLTRALIGGEVSDEIVDVVSQTAGGNPLFLEERLSSLMETGALIGDETGWRLESGRSAELPDAIERLVRSRVDRLDPGSHDVVVAASVLGAEFGLRALGTVTDLDGGLAGAVSQLCSAGLLVELRKLPEPTYRFRHALVREAAYKGLLKDQRRRLHARAAWGLEEVASGNVEEVAAVLGHHYAMAGETERAAHYLEVAGDHAASAFANDEAVASYRYGLDVLDQGGLGPGHPGGDANAKAAVGLWAKLGEVLLHTGRHAEAREALEEALPLVDADDRSRAARLQALLGRVEIADHRYDAAMAAFNVADELIGEHPEDQDQATVDLWLEVQLDGRTYLHYWRNEPDKAAAVLAAARPVVEARGTPARRQTFYMNFALQQSREKRYRVDEEILTNMRAAVLAAHEGGHELGIAFTLFGLGFCLLWHGDLAEAQERLKASLAVSERIGDVVLRARCLCYLNVTALRRNDVEAVRSLAPQAIAAGEAAAYKEYVAAGKASQAWVAWRDELFEDVVTLANEALELWGTTVVSYSWYWLCLWPLIAVRLASGQVAEAIEAGRQLLETPQQRLPDELEAMLQAAIAAWDNGEAQLARGTLSEAVELAQRLRYA